MHLQQNVECVQADTHTCCVATATAVAGALPADLISLGLVGLEGADTGTRALDDVLG